MTDSVVVVGGGPIGLMAACELGLAGVRAIVLERLEQPSEHSFGMAINPAVVELLDQRGLMETLASDGMAFPMAHFAHVPLDPARLGGTHPYNFAVPQSRLTARLAERAVQLGVEIRYGAEVTGIVQDEDGVLVRTRDGDEVRGSYVVGCDGAGSVVRRLVDVDFVGSDLTFSGITGDVEAAHGDPIFQLLGPHQYDTGFVTVAPSGPNVVRVTTGEFDTEPADGSAPVDLAELLSVIARISGVELSVPEQAVRWLARWSAPTRQADRYRVGRVLLAGDAAHVHFPLGGLSLSTGIEDAVNLGWKLAATVNGWAPTGLLETYQTERHPVGARACQVTRAQVALLHPMETVNPLREMLGELIQFADVNEFLVKLVGGVGSRYSMPGEPSHPLAGCRLADRPLRTDEGETSLLRLLRSGRPLLLTFGSQPELESTVSEWTDRVDCVHAEPDEDLGATALLLRPDGRVAWATVDGSAGSLPAALHTWFGAPSSSAPGVLVGGTHGNRPL